MISSVKLLGIAREFRRLGEPEVFFLIEASKDFEALIPHFTKAKDKWEIKEAAENSIALRGADASNGSSNCWGAGQPAIIPSPKRAVLLGVLWPG